MKKIVIIGAGAMGTAFAVPCSDNGHEVHVIGTHLEDNLIEKILSTNIENDKSSVVWFNDLQQIINGKG